MFTVICHTYFIPREPSNTGGHKITHFVCKRLILARISTFKTYVEPFNLYRKFRIPTYKIPLNFRGIEFLLKCFKKLLYNYAAYNIQHDLCSAKQFLSNIEIWEVIDNDANPSNVILADIGEDFTDQVTPHGEVFQIDGISCEL